MTRRSEIEQLKQMVRDGATFAIHAPAGAEVARLIQDAYGGPMSEATSDARGEGPPPVEGEVLRWRKNDKPDGEWRAVSHPYQCWVEDRSGGLARTWAAKIGIEAKTRLATALVEAREHIDDLEGDLAMIQPDDAWDEVTKLSEGIGIPLDKSHYGVLCGSHTLADVIGCVARNARECIAALESEVGAARGLLDRVATTEIPLCSGEHGKACDCVGDAVRAHLAAGWTTERRNGEAIPAERIAELLRCLDAEAAFARDAGRSADGFEVGDFERDPWTTMTHDELHSLLVAAQPAAPPAGEPTSTIHGCCGCSCHHCAEGHNTSLKPHTGACRERIQAEIDAQGGREGEEP